MPIPTRTQDVHSEDISDYHALSTSQGSARLERIVPDNNLESDVDIPQIEEFVLKNDSGGLQKVPVIQIISFSLHTDIDTKNIPQIKDNYKPEPKQMISLGGMNRSGGKKRKFEETDYELRPNEAKRWCGSF